jgi:hypothetical protein
MDNTIEYPAVTDNSIVVNYIKDTTDLILVVTVRTDQGTDVQRVTVTDVGARAVFLTTVAPMVWNTQAQFDAWYERYLMVNQS